ncbi:MAG: hypothetical protein CMF72_15425 [Mameliella sp.]|nr:hypothetical protein [Mameliella sp.]|tara:strand:- start:5562 stop:5768 length:207 start_codon:yes stop_codon:yes gene_type:complete
MSAPDHVVAALDRASKLESLLRVLSLAMDGEQVAGAGRLDHVGGGAVLDMAADMAREIVAGLEYKGKG